MNIVKKVLSPKVIVPILILIALLLVPVFTSNNYVFQVGAVVFLYVYFAQSWNIMGGLVGSWPMGSGIFIAVGAYCCAIVQNEGGTAIQSIPYALVISALLAVIIGKICFRLSGTYFSLSTVACLFVTKYIIVGSNTFLGHETRAGMGLTIKFKGGFEYLQSTNKAFFYYLFLALVVLAFIITVIIMKTKIGYYFTAIRTNKGAAATIGVPVDRYKTYGFVIMACMLSIGGVMFASFNMLCDPYVVLAYDMSLQIMMFVIIGGIGTLYGPIIGAAFLMLVKEVARVKLGTNYGQLALVVFGVVLCLCILYAPKGLWGIVEKVKQDRADKKKTAIAAKQEATANE